MEDKNQEAKKELFSKMNQMAKNGTKLYLDGTPATPLEVAEICVRETPIYMPDYVMDEDGSVKQVRFDKITDF